jgi:hypothetical protein
VPPDPALPLEITDDPDATPGSLIRALAALLLDAGEQTDATPGLAKVETTPPGLQRFINVGGRGDDNLATMEPQN